MNAMKRAHEIRKEAAKKWNCKTSEIIFSICLEMAWAEIKNADLFKKFETAAKLCVTGAAGLKKLAKSTGKNDIVSVLKALNSKFEKSYECKKKGNNSSAFGLFLNLEINKL